MKVFSLTTIGLWGFASVSAFAAYDSSFYKTEYWSGEYPHSLTVYLPKTVLKGRARMDKEAPADVSCPLPYRAVFSPWNERRSQKSHAHYFTASKIVKLTLKEDYDLQTYENDLVIHLMKGSVVEYLIYGAEGSFTVRIGGKEYEAEQALFDRVEAVDDAAFKQDEWLRLRCENGKRAWIFMEDLAKEDAQGNVTYTPGAMQSRSHGEKYGTARDLTTAEAERIAREP